MSGRQGKPRRPEGGGPRAEKAALSVIAHPGARREEIGPMLGGALKVAVTAPPDRGRANQAVLALLARWLGLPRGNLSLLRGGKGRRKEIRIEGISSRALEEKLARLSGE